MAVIVLAGLWLGYSGLGQYKRTENSPPAIPSGEQTAAAVKGAAQPGKHVEQLPSADPASLPADTVWTFHDGSSAHTYAVALDELYAPAGPGKQRIHALPPQPTLAALLTAARTLAAQIGTQPELVLYPLAGPHDEGSRRIVTMKVHIETEDLRAVEAAAASLGLTAWQTPAYAPGHAIAEVTGDPAAPLRAAAFLAALPNVSAATPLFAHQRAKRTVSQPTDTLFAQQWHLKNTGQQGGVAGIDINVTPVWPVLNGTGITIGIVDDGLQITHPDLAANIAASGNYDWNGHDTDPSPDVTQDFHGTAVAGLAAARDNGIGVVGAAPEATLYGLRLIALPETDQDDADAMAWKNDIIQIKSNSWGPADDTPWVLGDAGSLWLSAVANGTATGRGGLGTIYVWAAGNGKANDDEGTKDAYSSNVNVISVGAVTNTGVSAYFSEGGPHLVVCAPGDASIGIVTTDLTGANGYNDGHTQGELGDANYTEDFAGTSASTPIVSGVIALMLEANPNLGWRDVKEILLRTSTQLQPTDSDWVTRDGGQPDLPPIKHHPFFGGGLINAQAATALASTWTNLGTETVVSKSTTASKTIPDAGAAINIPFDLSSDATLRVENIELTVNITHSYRGDLEIKLTSPSGTVSTFTTPTVNDYGTEGYPNWTFSSVRHWGETSQGTWTLSIRDAYKGNTGKFLSATLKIHGVSLHPHAVTAPSSFEARLGTTVALPLVTDNGTYTYSYTGLPKGLTYSKSTGVISGRTTTSGTFPLVLTAKDTLGIVTTVNISLIIDPLPAALVGVFSGMVDRDAGVDANLGGAITFTTTATGQLTGKLTLGGTAYSFKGNLDGAPGAHATASITIPRSGLSPLLLQLDIPLDNTAVTGTLNATVAVTAWRNPWSKTSPATAYAGRYTFAMETPSGSGWPAGYSTGTLTVPATGTTSWTIQPADGTAALQGTTTLSADGTVPLFAPVKTPAGSFLGFFSLPVNTSPASSIDGTVSWLRGATTSALYANAAGFGPLAMTLHGGRYTAPVSGTLLFNLPATTGNADLEFGGADVDLGSQASILAAFALTLASQNKVVLPSLNPTTLKLTVNASTGQFSGAFTLTDPNPSSPASTVKRSEKFSGVFLLQENLGAHPVCPKGRTAYTSP